MKWNMIIAKAIKDGASVSILQDTADEMQDILDFVKSIEPELYWKFKSKVLVAVNGSVNDEYGITYNSYVYTTEDIG